MSKTATDLLVDILKEDDLWSSFADVAQRVYDSKLGSPLKELERIRYIDQDTDPVFIERAIRQAGINLTSEFFEHNKEKLTNSFYQLIKFWETDGNPNYPKFISFLLGRDFKEDVLYTSDYIEFSPTHGKLVVDGGNWYSTSTVDIAVDVQGLKESLTLRITTEDIPSIRELLGYSTATDEERVSINETIRVLQLKELTTSDNPAIVRKLIENRILKVYYQFAPIEKVVRDIYLTISAVANIGMFGSSLIKPKRYVDPNKPAIVSMEFVIPSKVQGFRKYPAHVLVSYMDETQASEYPISVSGEYVKSFDGKTIEFSDIDFVTDIEFTYTAKGTTKTVMVELYPIGTPFIPDELQIVGSVRPLEEATNTYRLITRHDNVREYGDEDRITWSIDSEHASFKDNVLVIEEIFEEYPATVTAKHRNVDGSSSSETLAITLVPKERNVVAKSIRIVAEQYVDNAWVELNTLTDIVQGMTGVFLTAIVEYTDGSEKELYSLPAQFRAGSAELTLPYWQTSTTATSISETGEIQIPIVYRDFTAEFAVNYQEDDRVLNGSIKVFFKKPRLVVESIEIIGPSSVLEETRNVYQLQATWSNGMISIVDADWSSRQTANAVSTEISDSGLMTAPSVDDDAINVSVNAIIDVYRYDEDDNESIVKLATSKTVEVKALRREVNSIEALMPQSLSQGNTNRVRFYVDWNDNSNTQIIPYRVELKQGDRVLSKYVRLDSGYELEHEDNVPVILSLSDDQFNAIDESLDHPQFLIEYLSDTEETNFEQIKGLVDIYIYYINPLDVPEEGVVLTDEELDLTEVPYSTYATSISVTPKIFLTEDLEIIYAENMPEGTRTFLTAIVTYANGEQEQANATWSIEPSFIDQEIEADLTQGQFTIEGIVKALIGVDRVWLDSNELTQAQVDRLIDGELFFKVLAEEVQADWTQAVKNIIDNDPETEYPRAVIQTRTLLDGEQQSFKVTARYFQQVESVTITSNANPVQAIDKILNSRIEGPGEIYADNTLDFSYGLVVDYDDLGDTYMVSSDWRVDVVNKAEVLTALLAVNESYRSLLPTHDDLSIYEVSELDEDQLSEVFQSIQIAEIDNEGYLYPRININAQLLVYADYDDGITQFTEQLDVFMKSTNAILTGMYMYNITNDGQFERSSNTTPSDATGAGEIIRLPDVAVLPGNPDSFADIDPTSGKLFYRFKAKVERNDELGNFYDPEVVEWSLETSSNKVSLTQPSRNVIGLLVNPVETDTQVIINGVYTEEFARSTDAVDAGNPAAAQDRVETVASSLRFIIESSKAIDVIEQSGQTVVYDDPDSIFVPTVRIQRRDGTYVTDPNAMVTWYVVSGPIGITYDAETKGFKIPKLTNNTVMVLRATAKEGLRTISEDFEYTLLMQFTPTDITLTLPQTVQTAIIDAGEYELGAIMTGSTSQGPDTLDVSDSAFFFFNYNEPDAEFDENVLSISPIVENKEIEISIKAKDYPSFTDKKTIKVYSSFPLFGTYLDGVNNSVRFNDNLGEFEKQASRTGGTFEINPDADEYGYFAHPKALGRAEFTYIPEPNSDTSLFGEWQEPITVTRVYETDLDEAWYLYRTSARGFSRGKFSVRYIPE